MKINSKTSNDLRDFYSKLSFLSYLEEINVDEWQKEFLQEIWSLKHGTTWTDQKITELIESITEKHTKKILSLLEE